MLQVTRTHVFSCISLSTLTFVVYINILDLHSGVSNIFSNQKLLQIYISINAVCLHTHIYNIKA